MIEAEVGRTPIGRRSYPVAYRIEFLRRWDECLERGTKARLMRENNLNRATVDGWLKARDRGEFTASMVTEAEKSRSRRMNSRERTEVAKLRAENDRLKEKVVQAEVAQEILGNAFELAGDHRALDGRHDGDPAGADERERVRAVARTQKLERRSLS